MLGAKEVTVRYHLRQLRENGLIEISTRHAKSPNVRYRLSSKVQSTAQEVRESDA